MRAELFGDFLDNREVKVKWETVIKSSSMFQMKGLRYKLLGTLIAVASNGGYIAITSDKTNPLPASDRNLSENIVIHDNKGAMVGNLPMDGIVVAIDFLENQQLLVLMQRGDYLLYNPYTKTCSDRYSVGGNTSDLEADPIVAAKVSGNSLIYMTQTCQIYYKEIAGKSNRYKLYKPMTDNELDSNAMNFAVLPATDTSPLQVFVPTKSSGVLRVYNTTVPKVERVMATVTELIVLASISPCGQNLAILTRTGMLVVISIKSPTNEWRKKLDIDEGEIGYLQKIEWVGFYAVALVFKKKIKYACCGQKEMYFEIRDEVSTSNRTNFIIAKSEIDGLRIIRIFENSHEQNCSIVRKQPQAYINVNGAFTSKPGYVLFEGYLAFANKKPIQEQDIRQEKKELIEAVCDLVDCGCYEIDAVGLCHQ